MLEFGRRAIAVAAIAGMTIWAGAAGAHATTGSGHRPVRVGRAHHRGLAAGPIRPHEGPDPTADPTANTDPDGIYACGPTSAISALCEAGALFDFNRGRKTDGLGPMTLPTNFTTLTVQEQLMVLADIDRVDHGLPPVAGISNALQSFAQDGAASSDDPDFPSYAHEGGSNWAGTDNSLLAEFLWMYDDGPGSGNLDCTPSNHSGCWGHRHDIIGDYDAPILMGTGSDAKGGTTQLFVGQDTSDMVDELAWADETQYFPVGVSASAVQLVAGRKTETKLDAWASGEAMTVTADITSGSSGWTVSPSSCDLAAGQQCELTVTYTPPTDGLPVPGTLTLTGPNGPVTVSLTPQDPSTLTLSAPKSVRGNALAKLTGVLTDAEDSSAISDASVAVQTQTAGHWTTLATATTSASGTIEVREPAGTAHRYRLLYAGSLGHASKRSSVVQVPVVPVVAIANAPKTAVAYARVPFTITVAPAASRGELGVQVHTGGSWQLCDIKPVKAGKARMTCTFAPGAVYVRGAFYPRAGGPPQLGPRLKLVVKRAHP